ncbi:MAG: PASTA domain-containing protein, partial [Spirochaetaceae bacterium]
MARRKTRLRNLLPRYGDRPEVRYFKITVYSFLGIALLTIVAGLGTFLLSLRGREQVLVPELTEKELPEALVELQERELHGQIELRYHSDPTLKGKVVAQEPASGALVRAGKEVELTVSRGAIVERVDDYVGRSLQEVRNELTTLFTTFDALLQIGDVSYVYSDEPAGTILEQDPEPDTELTSGTTELDLVVSRGEDVDEITLSSYAGLEYREAIDLLSDDNIPFTFDLADEDSDGAAGIVVEQDPEEGTSVDMETPVHLTMVPPEDIGDSMVFGMFRRVLPNYPVSVDVTLEAIDSDGERRTLLSMEHPGGEISVPYVVEENSRIVLSRFDTEVLSEQARPIEDPAALEDEEPEAVPDVQPEPEPEPAPQPQPEPEEEEEEALPPDAEPGPEVDSDFDEELVPEDGPDQDEDQDQDEGQDQDQDQEDLDTDLGSEAPALDDEGLEPEPGDGEDDGDEDADDEDA